MGGLAAAAGGACPWQSDEYMRPVLVEDELLLHDWEEENEGAAGAASVPTSSAAQLQRENDALRSALAAMQELALQDDALNRLVQEQRSSQAAAPSKPYDDLAAEAGPSTVPTPEAAAAAAVDATYFESYSFFDIHREMLGDKVRTEAYQTALESNPSLIKGATVLDLGCGTGVLSLFAARAGAARVVAVDGSPEIAEVARKICAANGQGGEEGVVTVVSSRVEQLQELPGGGKADVLVSEWMGEPKIITKPAKIRPQADAYTHPLPPFFFFFFLRYNLGLVWGQPGCHRCLPSAPALACALFPSNSDFASGFCTVQGMRFYSSPCLTRCWRLGIAS